MMLDFVAWIRAQARRAVSVGGIAAFTELSLQLGRGENDADHYLDGLLNAAWSEIASHGIGAAVVMVLAPALLLFLRRLGAQRGTEPLHADWLFAPPPDDDDERF